MPVLEECLDYALREPACKDLEGTYGKALFRRDQGPQPLRRSQGNFIDQACARESRSRRGHGSMTSPYKRGLEVAELGLSKDLLQPGPAVLLVDPTGIEPVTSAMPWRFSPTL